MQLKTFCIAKERTLFINEQKWLLDTANIQGPVSPEKKENRKFSPCFISGDTFTINTLLFHKHTIDPQIKAKCFIK